jgi:hypothetical protein
MAMATRVRIGRYSRQPDPVAYSTVGNRLLTGVAQACAGKLPAIARLMNYSAAKLFKWAEGTDRGPEFELDKLFAAAREAGVPRERMAILPAAIQAKFEVAYAEELPTLDELDRLETAIDGAEDVSQMARRLAGVDRDALARNYQVLLEDIAVRQTLAARMLRDLHAMGLT